MRNQEDSQWDDPEGVEDYHNPFRFEHPYEPGHMPQSIIAEHQRTVEEANAAVALAIAEDAKRTKADKALQAIRMFLFYYLSYRPRELLALLYCYFVLAVTKKDRRLVSQKAWRMFKL